MEPTLRSAQVLKQEAEDLGFEGKEILDYVKDQQKLDREERAEWRKIRMAELQGEDRKRADEIRIAQIGADSTGAIVINLASNVNLSHYMDLWTLGGKLQKNNCWTFFQ